jgi:hypothetical protein
MARQGFRSVRQVERAGGVGNDTISSRHRREVPPTDTVTRAIARAFDLSFEEVHRISIGEPVKPSSASGEPPTDDPSPTLRELWDIVSQMPMQDQRAVLDYALFRRSRSEQQDDERSPRASGASQQSPAASDGGA